MKGSQLRSQPRKRSKGAIKGGDLVVVPAERGIEIGRVKRTAVGYSYSWVTIEWPDGTINEYIASKVKKVDENA